MDVQKLTDDIATLKRALRTAPTAQLKEAIKKKLARLNQTVADAHIPTKKLAVMLLGARRRAQGYSAQEFDAVIKRLSVRDEYHFLKGMTKGKIKDDLKRTAKNVGWRFKGRNNFKTPTALDVKNRFKTGKVYMETRKNRSDVTKPALLKTGGSVGDYKVGQHGMYGIAKPRLVTITKISTNGWIYVTDGNSGKTDRDKVAKFATKFVPNGITKPVVKQTPKVEKAEVGATIESGYVTEMPRAQYERIDAEINNVQLEDGGGINSVVNKYAKIQSVCQAHNCTTDMYHSAKKKYGTGGTMDSSNDADAPVLGGTMGSSMRYGGAIEFDADSDSFWVADKSGAGQKSFETRKEAEDYLDGNSTFTCEVFDANGARAIDDASIKKLTECTEKQTQTKALNIDRNGDYKPERVALHKKIIDHFKKGVTCIRKGKPIAVLMGGAPASGKSTFLKKYRPYLLSDGIFKVDADEIRAMLPEYKGWNATQTHEETSDIVKTLISDRTIGVPCLFDFIYDGTMTNYTKYVSVINMLKGLGYDIYIVFMSGIPKETLINRAMKRYQKSGRFVPVRVIDDFISTGEKSLEQLKKDVNGYIVIDGSSDDYKILEQGGKKLPNNRLYEKLGDKIKLKNGGQTEEEDVDLFEHYGLLPERVRVVIDKYSEEDPTYETMSAMQKELEALGYTFEYGLDASPYGLKEMKNGGNIDYYKELVKADRQRLKNATGGEAEFILQNLAYNQKMLRKAKKAGETKTSVALKKDGSPIMIRVVNKPKKDRQLTLYYKPAEKVFKQYENGKWLSDISEEDLLSKINNGSVVVLLKTGGTTKKEFVQNKVAKVMHEFKAGELKTSAGKKVTMPKQAVAIGLSEGKAGWKHRRKK